MYMSVNPVLWSRDMQTSAQLPASQLSWQATSFRFNETLSQDRQASNRGSPSPASTFTHMSTRTWTVRCLQPSCKHPHIHKKNLPLTTKFFILFFLWFPLVCVISRLKSRCVTLHEDLQKAHNTRTGDIIQWQCTNLVCVRPGNGSLAPQK